MLIKQPLSNKNLPFQKRNQGWRAAQRAYGAVLPQAIVDDLVNREISENDYDLLMQLDRYVPWEISTFCAMFGHTCHLSVIK